MANTDDRDRFGRGDDIPAAIANLGVIIGSHATRHPANDNRPRPEPEAIGSSGNRDEAGPD